MIAVSADEAAVEVSAEEDGTVPVFARATFRVVLWDTTSGPTKRIFDIAEATNTEGKCNAVATLRRWAAKQGHRLTPRHFREAYDQKRKSSMP